MENKKCARCNIVKSWLNFNKDKSTKDGRKRYCKKCAKEQQVIYLSNEVAHVKTVIGSIFKPSSCERRGFLPLVSKQEIWETLLIYIQDMKNKFPGSDGRICSYCEQPWTNKVSLGGIKQKNLRNFSIDRIDNSKTYTVQNIVFCCAACNDNKHSASLTLMKKTLQIAKERKLI